MLLGSINCTVPLKWENLTVLDIRELDRVSPKWEGNICCVVVVAVSRLFLCEKKTLMYNGKYICLGVSSVLFSLFFNKIYYYLRVIICLSG